ncbi:hypothetical protein ACWKSP_09330 [Micromonosporaceae bacterium Da 78-11]
MPPASPPERMRLGGPMPDGDDNGRIRSASGQYLLAAARDDAPARFGSPAGPVDDTARRVWDSAFRLVVRRRFEPESPLAEISRTVALAVHTHEAAGLPALDAEMLVRDALGETVPVEEIDPAMRLAVHLLVFATLADEMALGDGELDGLIAQAEELAGAIS